MIKKQNSGKEWFSYENYRRITSRVTYIMAPCGYIGQGEPCADCPITSCKYNFGDWLSERKTGDEMVSKYVAKAGEMIAMEKFDAAIKLLSKFPENEIAMCGLGTTMAIKGDMEQAGNYFEKLTEIHPEYYGGWNGLGMIEFINNDMYSAMEILKSGEKGTKDGGVIKCNMGFIYILMEDFENAEKYFQSVINTVDDNEILSMALYGKGIILSVKKEKNEALSVFRKALELSPEDELIKSALEVFA